MTIVFFCTLFVAIQAAVFSAIAERNINAWKLSTMVEVLAIICTVKMNTENSILKSYIQIYTFEMTITDHSKLFQAIFGSVFRIAVHTWCLRKKGPIYVAMFKPLGMAAAVVLTVIFLGSTLFLGRYNIFLLTLLWQVKKHSKINGSLIEWILQCDWIHCNCTWILFCDLGTNEREKHGYWHWKL